MVLPYTSKTNSVTEQELITACQRRDRTAQKYLFDRYSAKMYGICKRYVKDHQEAEDVLIEGTVNSQTDTIEPIVTPDCARVLVKSDDDDQL